MDPIAAHLNAKIILVVTMMTMMLMMMKKNLEEEEECILPLQSKEQRIKT